MRPAIKDAQKLNLYLDKEVVAALDELSARERLSRSAVVERLVRAATEGFKVEAAAAKAGSGFAGLSVEERAGRSGAAARVAAGVPARPLKAIAASPSDNKGSPSGGAPRAEDRRQSPPSAVRAGRGSRSAA